MKRIIPALLAIALIGTTVQDARALGVYASWWNMDAANEDGFGLGVRVPIQIIPLISVDARTSWVNFSDSDMNVYPIEVIGLVTLGIFYGGLGVGYYFFDASNASFEVKDSAGWNVVAGATLGLSKLSIFGEVKWTEIEPDIEAIGGNVNVPNSLDAAGVGFNLGVMIGL